MEIVSLYLPEKKRVPLGSIDIECGNCSVSREARIEDQPISHHEAKSEGDDGKEEPLDAQRWYAHDDRGDDAERDSEQNRNRNGQAVGKLHGEICANCNESKLPQRELSCPSGEDSYGEGGDDPHQNFGITKWVSWFVEDLRQQ